MDGEIATISHRIKIEKGEERQVQSIFYRRHFSGAKAMMKIGSRSETADEGGYDDGTFHPSTNPYSGCPEQGANRTGCMHGV